MQVELNRGTTIEDLVKVARFHAEVIFSEEYKKAVQEGVWRLEQLKNAEEPIYGINTGLGKNCTINIPREKRLQIQKNHILAHSCAVGEPLAEEEVRAMLFVMLVHFGMGKTGMRLEVLERLRYLLNENIIPVVPRNGSVGYLCLEGYIGQAVIGTGYVNVDGEKRKTEEVYAERGINPIVLQEKEGLTMVSGTTSVTALTALTVYDAEHLVQMADYISAVSFEVLKGNVEAMDELLMLARPHQGQIATARVIREMLAGSKIQKKYGKTHIQDALSLRCIPQLHGIVKETVEFGKSIVNTELNSSVDNPLLFDEAGKAFALMGCNADGSYCGMVADYISIALTNLCKMSERRIERILNVDISELTPFLAKDSEMNDGLMMLQYSAAGMIAQMRLKSMPATADNVPTCGGQEDYVSMGYNAAWKSRECVELASNILAIELICNMQGLEFYQERSSEKIMKFYYKVREIVPFFEKDVCYGEYVEKVARQLQRGINDKKMPFKG